MTTLHKIGAPAARSDGGDGTPRESWPHDQAGAPMIPPRPPLTPAEGNAAAPAGTSSRPAGAQPYEIPALSMGGYNRERAGVIVSAQEQASGETRSFHEVGPPRVALLAVCEQLDALAGDWKIVAISTPTSIFRDLQGIREHERESARDKRTTTSDPRTSEQILLATVGRIDLLAPLRHPGPMPGARRIA